MGDRAHTQVSIRHRMGSLDLQVGFESEAPWTVLFGPSGSGKSTILRAMAGLLRPDAGRIVLSGEVVFDSDKKIWVPPHQRRMRWSPQRAMLNPAKNVRWNVSFGGSEDARSSEELRAGAEHFGLANLDVTAGRLSGGERQRLAVVRAAIRARGRLLLLDEPFSGMDTKVRDGLIKDLRDWMGGGAVVSVTHDVGEAFMLQAEVVRICNGKVTAQGTAPDVLGGERIQLREWLG